MTRLHCCQCVVPELAMDLATSFVEQLTQMGVHHGMVLVSRWSHTMVVEVAANVICNARHRPFLGVSPLSMRKDMETTRPGLPSFKIKKAGP